MNTTAWVISINDRKYLPQQAVKVMISENENGRKEAQRPLCLLYTMLHHFVIKKRTSYQLYLNFEKRKNKIMFIVHLAHSKFSINEATNEKINVKRFLENNCSQAMKWCPFPWGFILIIVAYSAQSLNRIFWLTDQAFNQINYCKYFKNSKQQNIVHKFK